MPRRRAAGSLIAVLVVSVAVLMVSASVGTVGVPVAETLRSVAGCLPGSIRTALGIAGADPAYEAIIMKVRLPRIMLGFAAGAALGAAGACYQGLLGNPLADPYIIGVSSGAALGASIGIVLTSGSMAAFGGTIPLFAFAGAVASMVLVMALAQIKGKIIQSLPLPGVGGLLHLGARPLRCWRSARTCPRS